MATPAAVQALLAHGAEVTARDNLGTTPLHQAAINTNPAVVAVLLDRGAEINAMDSLGYRMPLDYAEARASAPAVQKATVAASAPGTARNR